MKNIITVAIMSTMMATTAMADTTEDHNAYDCAAEVGIGIVGGAAVGAVAGTAAVWAIGILAAPFTLGGSIIGAATLTGPAIVLGGKGGAVYGGVGGTAICAVEELNE